MKTEMCVLLGCLALAAAAPAEPTDAPADSTGFPTESSALVESISPSTGNATTESEKMEETTVKDEKSGELNLFGAFGGGETTPEAEKASESSEKAPEKAPEPPTDSKDKAATDKAEESTDKPKKTEIN